MDTKLRRDRIQARIARQRAILDKLETLIGELCAQRALAEERLAELIIDSRKELT